LPETPRELIKSKLELSINGKELVSLAFLVELRDTVFARSLTSHIPSAPPVVATNVPPMLTANWPLVPTPRPVKLTEPVLVIVNTLLTVTPMEAVFTVLLILIAESPMLEPTWFATLPLVFAEMLLLVAITLTAPPARTACWTVLAVLVVLTLIASLTMVDLKRTNLSVPLESVNIVPLTLNALVLVVLTVKPAELA